MQFQICRMKSIYLPIVLLTFCAALVACNSSEEAPAVESKMQKGFSWVVEDKLAGLPLPGGTGSMTDDLAFLKLKKIDLLVSLTEEVPGVDQIKAGGLESVHLPVVDFQAPTLEQLKTFVGIVDARTAADQRVGVHCHAGKGRTGTFLAAYFVAQGMTAEEAIAKIRALRPGSVETETQEQVIAEYEKLVAGG